MTLSCCSTSQARCFPRSCYAKYAGLTRASFTLRVYLLESIRVGTHRRSLPCPWSATVDGAHPCSRSAARLRTSPPFSMIYSARIDKLKAHIRDTGVPLCPNSYEPLFTCVNSNTSPPSPHTQTDTGKKTTLPSHQHRRTHPLLAFLRVLGTDGPTSLGQELIQRGRI